MTLDLLKEAFKDKPSFRLKQAIKLVFQDFIEDWDEASVFSIDLRKELNKKIPLNIKSEIFLSRDKKSGKAIIQLIDGSMVEVALMSHKDNRNTVCVSSQVGCPLACKFCATGKMGFKRNLDYSEILIQVLFWARHLKTRNSRVTNIVFMGMGEPLLNYENVFKSIKFLHDKDFFNISSRKISVSTVGIFDEIKRLSDEKVVVNLAVSLHSANDNTRKKLMPYAKAIKIGKLMEAVDYYIKTTGRKAMLEYLMIKGVNDGHRDLEELIRLVKGKNLLTVNLIPYNITSTSDQFEPSGREVVRKFKNSLMRAGINVIERYRFNQDVFSACGQMALKKKS
ncbi:MAG: 23S rRNA (adenine(2503)-C(2))-methyltransferase RlmN [Patescibacteria group bacterium]